MLDEEEVGRRLPTGPGRWAGAFALLVHCAPAAPSEVTPIEVTVGAPTRSTEAAPAASAPAVTASALAHPSQARKIGWGTDLDAAFEQARRSRRPLLVFVRAGWSSASMVMERTTLDTEIVERASRPYVPVIVDLTDDDVLARTEARLGVALDQLPAIELLELAGGRHASLRGATTAEQLAEALGAFVSTGGRAP